ncbi:hypothetical protein [Ottowia thiooxydans]|uniref:hypothetical protein n=1 Tax=Ottowia thiooxydans TaxID=219182 RepID=UPI0004073162|nr:hypothetical protein [Ottowia thiooxydans]
MTTVIRNSCHGLVAALAFWAGAAWGQVTYDFAGHPYGSEAIAPHTASMVTSGWVVVNASGLPPNAVVDLMTRATDWSLNDGITTFTSSNSSLYRAEGTTDASSVLTVEGVG